MRARSWLLVSLLLLALAGGQAMAADYTVVIDKMAFGALPAELHVGDTITWRNDDIFQHTATAADQSFDIDLPVKSAALMALTAVGTWDFSCTYHPGMVGTLVVLP